MKFSIFSNFDKQKVIDYIKDLPEGKSYTADVKLRREKRTIDQNSLLWLWVNCISDETGNEKNALHEYFKAEFLGFTEIVVFGKIQKHINSTTGLDTKQFTHYLEKIKIFAASELGIVLPEPSDRYWQEFYDKYKLFI